MQGPFKSHTVGLVLGLIGLLAIPTAVLVGGITLVWSGADKLSKLLDKDAF